MKEFIKELIKELYKNFWLIVILIAWIVSLDRGDLSTAEMFTTGFLFYILLELKEVNKRLKKDEE